MADRTYEEFDVGETDRTAGRTVTDSDIRMFIGSTGSTHPNHVDEEYARDHPLDFDDVLAHGVLTLGIADGFDAEEVTQDAALAVSYGHDDVRYLEPVYPGDTLSGVVEVVEKEDRDEHWGLITLDLTIENGDDETVLSGKHKVLVAKEAHPAV